MGGRLVKGMFHRAIISGMAVSPEDLAAGALALQVFVKNAKNVEIIVNVAFAVIPTVLGLGAAGLLGSGIINTAKDVIKSINLLKTVGPMAGLGLEAGKGLNKGRILAGERLKQYDNWVPRTIGNFLTLDQLIKSKLKNRKQDIQDKQDKQDGGGGGGNPPTPPDTKSDNKEERPKPTGIDTYSPISIPNPFKKKE